MRLGAATYLCLFLSCFASGAGFAQDAKKNKYAILIGVTRYEHASMNGNDALRYPEKDASSIGKLLAEQDYQVEYLLGVQARAKAIREKLDGLITKGSAEGVVFVGLFGHGVQAEVRDPTGTKSIIGCFCPYDAEIRYARDADGKALFGADGKRVTEPNPESLISMAEVAEALGNAKAETRFMIADCCRNLPNRARGRNLGLGVNFSTDKLPSQTVMLFGCRPGEESQERDDLQHGVFTKAVLDELSAMSQQGPVTTGILADRVKSRVRTLTDNKQNPVPISLDSIDLAFRIPVNRELASKNLPSASQPKQSVPPAMDRKARPKPSGNAFTNSIGMKFVLIPSGTFLMGSPDSDQYGDLFEKPQHSVTLTRSFYMGETEVTQKHWKAIMDTEPWKGLASTEGDDFPAMYISWHEALEYSKRLSERDGQAYRLPTEAEWEYACRGRTTTPFSFSGDINQLAEYGWYRDVSKFGVQMVKQKKPNPFGLYDMHGNVWEWCSDKCPGAAAFYGAAAPPLPLNQIPAPKSLAQRATELASRTNRYQPGAQTDPTGPDTGDERIVRGGGHNGPPEYCRSAMVRSSSPNYRNDNQGFRLVTVVEQ